MLFGIRKSKWIKSRIYWWKQKISRNMSLLNFWPDEFVRRKYSRIFHWKDWCIQYFRFWMVSHVSPKLVTELNKYVQRPVATAISENLILFTFRIIMWLIYFWFELENTPTNLINVSHLNNGMILSTMPSTQLSCVWFFFVCHKCHCKPFKRTSETNYFLLYRIRKFK